MSLLFPVNCIRKITKRGLLKIPSTLGIHHRRHSGNQCRPMREELPESRADGDTGSQDDQKKRKGEYKIKVPGFRLKAGMTIKTAFTRRGGPACPPVQSIP